MLVKISLGLHYYLNLPWKFCRRRDTGPCHLPCDFRRCGVSEGILSCFPQTQCHNTGSDAPFWKMDSAAVLQRRLLRPKLRPNPRQGLSGGIYQISGRIRSPCSLQGPLSNRGFFAMMSLVIRGWMLILVPQSNIWVLSRLKLNLWEIWTWNIRK